MKSLHAKLPADMLPFAKTYSNYATERAMGEHKQHMQYSVNVTPDGFVVERNKKCRNIWYTPFIISALRASRR